MWLSEHLRYLFEDDVGTPTFLSSFKAIIRCSLDSLAYLLGVTRPPLLHKVCFVGWSSRVPKLYVLFNVCLIMFNARVTTGYRLGGDVD